MEAYGGEEMGFHQESSNAVPNCESNTNISRESSVMEMSSMSMMHKPPIAGNHDPFFSLGWDPISSMTQPNFGPIVSHGEFGNFHFPSLPLPGSQGIDPHLANYPAHSSSLVEMMPRAAPFPTSRGLPDMVGPIGLPQYGPVAKPGPSHALSMEGGATEGTHSREGDTMASPSSDRRRKRTPDSSSPYEPNKNHEGNSPRDPSGETSDVQKEHNEKKQRTGQPESTNSQGKQTKEDTNSGEPPKENYIHVRARRGQATNSHSLAERVRREKISERMRMLQELVPGCNKITGKAVMLDEIINYVQSLQQQVEFLSMKLSTLLPDLSVDMERVLSKEILQARGRDSISRGLGPGMAPSLPYINAPEILQGALPSSSQYPSWPQASLDNELQTLFQMGMDPTSAIDMLKQNGRLKSER